MKLNVAFAGFRHGHIFDLYNRIARHDEIILKGAWENDAATREQYADKVEFNYASYEDILSDASVDVVAIGDYYAARGPLAIAALKAGKHVIADKPLARALYRATEVGDVIPVELFRAVAEVLAVVFAAKRRGRQPRQKPLTCLHSFSCHIRRVPH